MFSNMKIGGRLTLEFLGVMVLMVVIISVSLFRIAALNEEVNNLIKDKLPKTFLCDSIINNVNVAARSIRNVLIADSTEVKQQEYDRIVGSTGVSKEITADIEKLEKLIKTEKEKDLLKKMTEDREVYRADLKEVGTLALNKKQTEAKTVLLTKLRTSQANYLESVTKMIDYQNELVKESGITCVNLYNQTRVTLLGLGLVALVLAVIIAVWITRSITRPIAVCIDSANRIARGDTTLQIDSFGRDETGQLLAAMKTMGEKIRSLIAEVNGLGAAAVEGRLATRANVDNYEGDYRKLVAG